MNLDVPSKQPRSPMAHLFILIHRQVQTLLSDRNKLIFLLLSPVVFGCLDFLAAALLGKSLFDFRDGQADSAATSLFLLCLYALIVGVTSQMLEFTGERIIFKSERLIGLNLGAYFNSKILFAGVLALYQGTVFTVFHYLAFEMPGGIPERRIIFITLCLACFLANILGLVASAIAPGLAYARIISVVLMLLSIASTNILIKLPAPLLFISPNYWSFKNLVAASGLGADVAADDCWKFPAELRTALTFEDKEYYHCSCMGLAMFTPNSCNFPGIGKFYQPELEQDPPTEPTPPGVAPSEPDLPVPPTAPEDPDDYAANAIYLQTLQDYRDQVAEIQKNYQMQVISYQLRTELYRSQMVAYNQDIAEWRNARTTAVSAAEGLIAGAIDHFGWAFVSQEDPAAYKAELVRGWIGSLVWVLIASLIILIILKNQGQYH